jgi:uncharacterized ferritin-like protein (DUF455 family)
LNGKATETEGIDNCSNWEGLELALQLPYRAHELGYSAFASWLQIALAESKMQELIQEYIDIPLKLGTTPVGPL